METFEQVLEQRKTGLYVKLHKAKQEIGKVTKNAKNPFFKSNYADLNSLIEAVEPILLKYDLILLQPVINGTVESQIIDIESGDMVSSSLLLPTISDPQKLIASITYYRRGTLQSLLSLQAVDDDGNESSASVKATKQKAKPTITAENFDKYLDALEKGTAKMDKLKFAAHYQLTSDQLQKLA